MSATDLQREIEFRESAARFYEGARSEAFALGGPRKAAWALGQLRLVRAELDALRAQLGRPALCAPHLRIVEGGRP